MLGAGEELSAVQVRLPILKKQPETAAYGRINPSIRIWNRIGSSCLLRVSRERRPVPGQGDYVPASAPDAEPGCSPAYSNRDRSAGSATCGFCAQTAAFMSLNTVVTAFRR